MTISNLLSYILPPIVGAIIGWITNAIAIKMLFRPFNEKYIFKIKVPLTPGVIPKDIKRLSTKIGNVVGEKLLTKDEISKRLSGELMQSKIRTIVDSMLDKLLDRDIGKLSTILPTEWVSKTKETITKIIIDSLNSESTKQTIMRNVDKRVDNLLDNNIGKLEKIIPPELVEQAKRAIYDAIIDSLNSDDLKSKIKSSVDERVENLFTKRGERLFELLPSELIDKAKYHLYNIISDNIRSDELKRGIEKSVEEEINQRTRKYGVDPLIPKSLIDDMKGTITRMIIKGLTSDEMSRKIMNEINFRIDELLSKEMREISSKVPQQWIEQGKNAISNSIFQSLNSPEMRGRIHTNISFEINKLTAKDLGTLRGIIPSQLIDNSKSAIYASVIDTFSSENIKNEIYNRVNVEVDELLNKELGKIRSFLPSKFVMDAKNFICNEIINNISEEAKSISEYIGVKEIVEQKIQNYPLPAIEKMILEISEKHLKYIIYFGGLLGFLVGLLQVVIQLIIKSITI